MTYHIESLEQLRAGILQFVQMSEGNMERYSVRSKDRSHFAGRAAGLRDALELVGAYERSREVMRELPKLDCEWEIIAVQNLPDSVSGVVDPEPVKFWFASQALAKVALDGMKVSGAFASLRMYQRILVEVG